MRWKTFIVILGVLVLSTGMVFAADGEKWPNKPIELVLGWAPGGSADRSARAIIPGMSKELGVPINIIYKPGAAGALACEYLVKAKPDGYTICELDFNQLSRQPITLNVTWTMDDFTYLASHNQTPWVYLVKSDAPWKNYADFLAYSRNNPINYGTAGAYNSGHIIGEWISRRDNLKWSFVPHQGFAAVMPSILGGHIHFGASSGGHANLIESGKLRTLLQLTGEPIDKTKVTKLAEAYPDFPSNLVEIMGVSGIVGPKGIPAPIAMRLQNAIHKSAESPEFKQYAKDEYYKVITWNGEKVYDIVKRDHDGFGAFMKTIGFKKP